MDINLSELDTQRFKKRIAKLPIDGRTDIDQVIKACKKIDLDMLIARCPTIEISAVQKLEKEGFFLTDTLVYFQNKKITRDNIQLPGGYSWRVATSNDAPELGILATKCFTNFSGHYHTDPFLNKSDADLVYSSWASNSCHGGALADQVFLVCNDDEIAGFLSVKKIGAMSCEIILNGVDPAHQKKGFYSTLVSIAKNWAIDHKMTELLVSTQIDNIAPQKTWCRQGFEPLKSFHTFHKWFN